MQSRTSGDEPLNTYGAHMLVDFKPIEDADLLLEECEQFMVQTKTAMYTVPILAFSRVASSIKSWRSKRRDNKLMSIYEALQPKVVATEKILRKIIGEVVEKKTALRLQARHLQVRLEACIKHNKILLEASETPLEELRTIVNKLSGESTALKDMITFNREVLRIRNVESISKGQNYVRWGSKPAKKKTTTDMDIKQDSDHNTIEEKLILIRELREKFVSCMATLLESRETQMNNLDNSDKSMQAINFLIKRGGIGDVVGVPNGDPLDLENEPMSFDHSRCADCSYAYSITCDCTNHFSALQKQATDANQKLQALVEIREKMSEAYDQMMCEAMGTGGDSSKHGSFSSVRDATLTNRASPLPPAPTLAPTREDSVDDNIADVTDCSEEQSNVM